MSETVEGYIIVKKSENDHNRFLSLSSTRTRTWCRCMTSATSMPLGEALHECERSCECKVMKMVITINDIEVNVVDK